MELNHENLTELIDAAATGEIVVLDHWPGKQTAADDLIFVMHSTTKAILEKSRSTAVLSSRLPKILDAHRNWFDAIRTIGVKISRSTDLLLSGESTAAHLCCARLAKLFSIDHVTLKRLPLQKLQTPALLKDQWQVLLSAGTVFYVTQQTSKADSVLADVADTVFAISIRKNGNVETALRHRLAQDARKTWTYILRDNTLIRKSVREPLLAIGAIDWLLLAGDDAAPAALNVRVNQQRLLSDLDQSEYLIHWTRARPGAWPDQSAEEYWDDLIFGSGGYQHNEVFSLCRILASRRIIASAILTRDPTPVVCFSNVPLGKLRDKTIFRKHLQRWDFLPYGIAIKRSVLETQFGCRPVIYGNEETWQALSASDRPFFQKEKSGNKKINWQEESEWRVIGDVNLTKVLLSDAVVFAGDQNDLEKLSQLSIFDLIVI